MIDKNDVKALQNKINEIRDILLKQIDDLRIKEDESQPSWWEIEKDDIRQLV
jgi:hypothetical protein